MEHIASQSPKDLTRLVEQISGSLELAADYERTKKEVERAAENATESFNKRRGFAGEIRVFKEQMSEAVRRTLASGLTRERSRCRKIYGTCVEQHQLRQCPEEKNMMQRRR